MYTSGVAGVIVHGADRLRSGNQTDRLSIQKKHWVYLIVNHQLRFRTHTITVYFENQRLLRHSLIQQKQLIILHS